MSSKELLSAEFFPSIKCHQVRQEANSGSCIRAVALLSSATMEQFVSPGIFTLSAMFMIDRDPFQVCVRTTIRTRIRWEMTKLQVHRHLWTSR
jgi:hypothetical protein